MTQTSASAARAAQAARADALTTLVERTGLVDRLAEGRITAIVAPSGYGKSVLADQLAARLGLATVRVEVAARAGRDGDLLMATLRRALRAAGLRGVADALGSAAGASPATRLNELLAERDEGVLIVVDATQNLAGSGSALAAELLGGLPAPHRAVLVGLGLGADLDVLVDLRVGRDDLAFSAGETAELARSSGHPLAESQAARLVRATGGWPAAVGLAIESGEGTAEFGDLTRDLNGLVDRVVGQSGMPGRELADAIADLPLVSESLADAIAGTGALDRFLGTGLPLRERPDGWMTLPDPIRAVLRTAAPPSDDVALAVAMAYFDAGQPSTAINYIVERRAMGALARLLAARPWQDLAQFDAAELRAMVTLLGPSLVDEHPQLLLSVARAASAASELAWRAELLDRAAAAADPATALRREINAERAAICALDGDVEGAVELAGAVLSQARADEVATRARALAARGRARAFERSPQSLAAAARDLTEAATLARVGGERELLGAALQALGYSVHYDVGQLDSALTRLSEAAEVVPSAGRSRAEILTFLADAQMYSGQLDDADAVLREVAEVGHRLRDQGILGYHAWMKAAVASRRDDRPALATWLADAERHPGDWFGHPTGIEFLADAVDMLGRVGDHEAAAAYLARVERRCADDPHAGVDQIAVIARAIHNARAGDAERAQSLVGDALATAQLAPREHWRMYLLRGLAAHRAGDEERAAQNAARALEEATALGRPDLPDIHEPRALEALLPLVKRSRPPAAQALVESEPTVAIRALGGFALTVSGRPADPPPGRPQMLVKLLAISGHAVAADEAVEALWPEVDPDTGRARLRNVLARIRSASGDVVRRDGTALALAPDVAIDALEFERDGRAALAASGDEAVALARRAVSRYSGELLPADRYEDFAAAPRERLAMLHLTLVDRLAADAEAAGDVDEALRRYAEAIAAAPLDEHRYELAAALALRHGRRQRAADLVAQARRVLNDLGVEPSDALASLAEELGAVPLNTG